MALGLETSPEQLAKWISEGAKSELQELIRRDLEAHVAPIISELARKLARSTLVQAEGMYMPGPYGEKSIRMALIFNNKEVEFQDAPKK